MKLSKHFKNLAAWLKPDPPGLAPLTMGVARALTERTTFASLLSYRDMDERNFMHLDNGVEPAIGFLLGINPLMIAGVDAEPQIEAVLSACPADSIVQFGAISTPQVEGFLNQWTKARLENNTNPLLREVALRRREFMLKTAVGPSMLPQARLHPRMLQWYVAVRIPYKGELTDTAELNSFFKTSEDVRNTIQGALRGIGIDSEILDGEPAAHAAAAARARDPGHAGER